LYDVERKEGRKTHMELDIENATEEMGGDVSRSR